MPQQIERGDEAARAAREQRIIDMRSQGLGFREIGAELGISHSTAHEIWKVITEKYPARALEEYRQEQIDLVDRMIRIGLRELDRDHVLYHAGKKVQEKVGEKQIGVDDKGDPIMEPVMVAVRDSAPLARFLLALTSISKRKSEITGSDATPKLDLTVTQQGEADAALSELVAEMNRRNAEARKTENLIEQAAQAGQERL